MTLSGVVSDGSGSPVAGTTVLFNGESVVSGLDGSFVLHVPSGVSGRLTFNPSSSDTEGVSRLTAEVDDFAIGAQDVVANFVWPDPVRAQISVVDASSTPLVGALVGSAGGNRVPETLSNGTPILVSYAQPMTDNTCTTDSAGQCSLPALVGASPLFLTSYQPVPGDSSYPTFVAYGSALVTADAPNVTIQFANIASFSSDGTISGLVFVSTPTGTSLSDMSSTPLANNALPSGSEALTGALSYDVNDVPVGGSIDVTLHLPAGSAPSGVMKFQNAAYIDMSSIATIAGDQITLHLTDGGLGDADGVANGVIVDPVIPVHRSVSAVPRNVSAVPGDGAATVRWGTPVDDGGAPVNAYVVTSYHGTTALTSKSFASTARSGVMPGLTNGQAYSFKVAAKNVVGTGPSAASAAIPIGRPGPPTAVAAAPGDGQATVSWSAPSPNGTSAITGYVVTPYHGTTALASKLFASTARSGVISGLTNGQAYSFKVAAKNLVGAGPIAATAAIPIGPPSPPTAVAAVPGSSQATVSWSAPPPNGTSAVTGYVVTPYVGAAPQTVLAKSVGPSVSSVSLTGLTNVTAYTFKVAAKNVAGTGALSVASAAITVGAPTAPVVSAVGSSGAAALSWTAPANNGAAVTSYVVTTYLGSTLQSAKTHTLTCTQPCTPARTWTVTGLANGNVYTFRVVALNARGTSPSGVTTIKIGAPTLPGSPTSVHATAGSASATVSWVAPANGSATITAYVITPYKAGVAQPTITVVGSVTTRTITGLTAGQSYTFKVAARSAVGTGQQSTASNAVTPT